MAQTDVFKRYLDAGVAFSELTRARAEAIVKDLVQAGEIPRKRAEETIDDLIERSRQNTETLVSLVQAQIREQLGALGVATKDDIARLEAKIAAAAAGSPPASSAVKNAPAKRAPAKKAGAAKKA